MIFNRNLSWYQSRRLGHVSFDVVVVSTANAEKKKPLDHARTSVHISHFANQEENIKPMIRGHLRGVRNLEHLHNVTSRSFSMNGVAKAALASPDQSHQENVSHKHIPSIADILQKTPSSRYVDLLSSKSSFVPAHRPTKLRSLMLQLEVTRLINLGSRSVLLKLLLTWLQDKGAKRVTNDDFLKLVPYILEAIVKWQGILLHGQYEYLAYEKRYSPTEQQDLAKEVLYSVRKIYSRLLFPDSEEDYIYLREKRRSLGETDYDLTMKDYENLILLELNNNKLDLASKWFERLEQRYPDDEVYLKMTYNLWILRFLVYGNGLPKNWSATSKETNTAFRKPVKPYHTSEVEWHRTFSEYAKKQHLMLGNSMLNFDKTLLGSIIGSIASSKDTAQIYKFIEEVWGIDEKGQIIQLHKKLDIDDPCYPDIDTLRSIVVSLVYNGQVVKSMLYMNAFQENYGIDLSKESDEFWGQLFDWAEFTTRVSENKSLEYFICKTDARVEKDEQGKFVLELAKKSPDFDYEGFLTFMTDLKNQRSRLIEELWKCYREAGANYSMRAFVAYLSVIKASKEETKLYEYLKLVAQCLHEKDLPAGSFNTVWKKAPERLRTHYEDALVALIELKATAGELEVIEVVIRKWALDAEMETSLKKYVLNQKSRYLELNATEQNDEDGDDENFLGLI